MNKLTGPLLDAAQANRIDHAVAPSLERRRLRAYVMMMLADAIVLHLAFAGAGLVYEGVWWYARNMLAVQVLLPVYFTIALYNETYGGKSLDSWIFASSGLCGWFRLGLRGVCHHRIYAFLWGEFCLASSSAP